MFLTDQWVIAEYRELPMVIGSLQVNDWQIKSSIKKEFDLGTGHINWFKNRLVYLKRRHDEVKKEAFRRGFKCFQLSIDLEDCPIELCNDWRPTIKDSLKLRKRLLDKFEAKNDFTWWKYYGKSLTPEFFEYLKDQSLTSELFFV